MSNAKSHNTFESKTMIRHDPSHLQSEFSDEYARIFNRQRLKNEVAEAIFELMEQSAISRSDFAKLIGTSKSHVTQMLGGSRNFTLDSLADIFLALGRSVHVTLGTSHDFTQVVIDAWKESQQWEELNLKIPTESKSLTRSSSWKNDESWNDLPPSPFLQAS